MWTEEKLALFERYRLCAARAEIWFQRYLGAVSVDINRAGPMWSQYKRASTLARKAFAAFEAMPLVGAQA